MAIYSNRNKTSKLIPVPAQEKHVLRDLFHIEKYWAETKDKVTDFLGPGIHYVMGSQTY